MPLINHAGGGGGTPQLCSQVENFKVIPGSTALSARLSWEAPTVDEDSSFVGVRIVRKAGSAPEKVSDGTVVYEGTALTYTDTGLTAGTTYYYRAFAYNAKKKYQTEYRVVSFVATTLTIGATLNDTTWAQISAVSAAGYAPLYWSIGDTKSITLTGAVSDTNIWQSTTLDVFIIGFNHNASVEGSNRTHFHIGKQNGKQIGLYRPSDQAHVLSYLPADLKSVMKSVTKYETASRSTVASKSVNIINLGVIEVFGSALAQTTTLLEGKQAQYEYYAAGNSAQHFLNDDQSWSTNYSYYYTTGKIRLRDTFYTTMAGTSDRYYDVAEDGTRQTTDSSANNMGYMQAPIFFV